MPDQPAGDDPQGDILEDLRRAANAESLEQALGLPSYWSQDLVLEDDWSFVIKAHALVEAAANRALTAAVGRAELAALFERMELSNASTGKVAALEALGALDSDCKRFVRKFSELRNAFVHDVRNTALTMADYFGGLDKSDLAGFQKAFCWGIPAWQKADLRPIDRTDDSRSLFFVLASASWGKGGHRFAIWLGVLYLMRHLAGRDNRGEKKSQLDEATPAGGTLRGPAE